MFGHFFKIVLVSSFPKEPVPPVINIDLLSNIYFELKLYICPFSNSHWYGTKGEIESLANESAKVPFKPLSTKLPKTLKVATYID